MSSLVLSPHLMPISAGNPFIRVDVFFICVCSLKYVLLCGNVYFNFHFRLVLGIQKSCKPSMEHFCIP